MAWDNKNQGSHIPASSKRVVRLRQGNACICLDSSVCTGAIDEYDHVVNVKALKIERSHANDPALLQGLCIPCHKGKTQDEAQAARNRHLRTPAEHPGLVTKNRNDVRVDDEPGQPLVTIKEQTP